MRIPDLLVIAIASGFGAHAAEPGRAQIEAAMKQAAGYFRGEVARHGGYVYYVSPDLTKRLGEGVASPDQVWVQPPATPTVGQAYLSAHAATGDGFYLEAARECAGALLHGQLESGGWTNAIDFDPAGSQAARYRNGKGKPRGRNFSTLDDDITPAALRFLMALDDATDRADRAVHEGATLALDALLRAQFPNGSFPQGWDETLRRPEVRSPAHASLPGDDWRTMPRIKEYWDQPTLNDGVALRVTEVLIDAHRIYGRDDCRAALRRLGDFLLAARLPEPQPGWAQQYDDRLRPIWARPFEPAAMASRETESAVAALLLLSAYLDEPRFLEPIPAALDYLDRSRLPDGRLARYYELGSNRPLYMKREGKGYVPTFDDSQLPGHYGWKVEPRSEELRRALEAVRSGKALPGLFAGTPSPTPVRILESLDDQGRWISRYSGETLVGQPRFAPGEAYLSSERFARNLEALSTALRRE